MKIAYLSTFYPFRGGIAQFNGSLYRAMEKEHKVTAYTFTRQYPEILFPGKTQMVSEDDIADAIPSVRVLDSVNPFNWMSTASKIAAEKPDLLVMKYWMSYMAPCLGYVAGSLQSKGTKVMTIVDNAIPHERKFFDNAFAKYFLNRNDMFVAMSDSVRQDILSLKPDARILLKEHPLYDHFGALMPREQAIEKLGLNPHKKTLLFFGFIRDYKGLDLLIDAFGKLGDDYQLIIAGESYGSFDSYQNQIDQLPNKHSVYLKVGYIADHEVPVLFGASDAVVLPYKTATQSGISAIAFHFEIPIIATDVGGLKEIIADEKTGIIVPQPETAAIVSGIEKFFSFPKNYWAQHMSSLKVKLSWDNFSKEILEFASKF